MNLFLLSEALASVALSHAEGCVCDVCEAAAGDQPALERMIEMAEKRETRLAQDGGSDG